MAILKFKKFKKAIGARKKKKEKKVAFQSPKGMHDILPNEQPWWEKIRKTTKDIAEFYNFLRIDTSIVESAEIFEKSGQGTDIVEKQMFFLKSKSGAHRLALRPEGTAGIIRAYLQHNLSHFNQALKLYYFGQMFRYERPQAGRYRQFHHVGFEILGGDDNAIYDAQIILITLRFIEELKIKNLIIYLNSVGCKICRPGYQKKLQIYYRGRQNRICKDCRRRLSANPLRLLDCKNEECEIIKTQAPVIIDHLCQSCRNHLKNVLEYLDELELPYTLNPYLVRGLDYYNRTVFEIFSEMPKNSETNNVGKNLNFALAGGGRYDYLAEMLSSRQTKLPAVGSSIGVERLIETLRAQQINPPPRLKPKIFLIQMGEPAKKKSLALIEKFRQAGLRVSELLAKNSLKSQLKTADKEEATLTLILGQKEVFEESIIIRDMKSGAQETMPLNKVVDEAKRRLK